MVLDDKQRHGSGSGGRIKKYLEWDMGGQTMSDKICPIGTVSKHLQVLLTGMLDPSAYVAEPESDDPLDQVALCFEEGCGMFFFCHQISAPLQQKSSDEQDKSKMLEKVIAGCMIEDRARLEAVLRDVDETLVAMHRDGQEMNEYHMDNLIDEIQLLRRQLAEGKQ
jgi:hypothetical protein